MAEQLPRPKDRVEVYWFSEQPYGHVTDADLEKYESGRLGFPNTHFDPEKAHVLYNQYHEQYALADEVGFDGIAVIIAHQVEDAVRDEELELQREGDTETARLAVGGVGRDHDLPHQSARRSGDFEREGQDVCPTADASEGAVETADLRVVHDGDVDAAPLTAHRAERALGGTDQRPDGDGDPTLAIFEGRAQAH